MQQMRVSVKQKRFQFVLERVQREVCRPQIVRQTVPHSWSKDREPYYIRLTTTLTYLLTYLLAYLHNLC